MSSKIPVTLSQDHLKSLAVASRPLSALAEIIWNGLDADAERIAVRFDRNALDTVETIRIQDDGNGINYDHANSLFGTLGDSWKRTKNRTTGGRGLHGKSGKGRFIAFSLGSRVTWHTTSNRDGVGLVTYRISGTTSALDGFEVSDPVPAGLGAKTGTEVIIENLYREFGSLTSDDAAHNVTREYASYLAEYPIVRIDYDGIILDPASVQTRAEEFECDEIVLSNGTKTTPTVRIIEWTTSVERSLYLCDSRGVSIHEVKLGTSVRAPGYNFTAYLKSDAIRELDKNNQLVLEEVHPDVDALINAAKNTIKAYFRMREVEDLSKVVDKWKEEKIYPYEDKPDLNSFEEAERQVFDILAVNVQEYLPEFEASGPETKRFTFRLLSQALKENPDSLQQIMGEVLGLKKEAQDDLAELLKKTPLASIISSARIVANRLDFLTGLENLLFDQQSKEQLLERDQLHKILENEAWLFKEEFTLAGSEMRLEEVLNKHLDKLGKREDDPEPVAVAGRTGRVDLMLHKAVQPRSGEYDYLVVELKRPSKKIDFDVLSQIEKYAIAVAQDERFHGVKTRWIFQVISNQMETAAERKAHQRDRPVGLVFDDADLSITVWAKTWAEIINDARARLRFFKDQLAYEADRDSAKAYLKKAHAKFLPSASQKQEHTSELPNAV